jgi:N-methylhydantoinase B
MRPDRTTSSRGVRLAVLSNRFEAVVRSMRNTLTRTSRSGVINIARDFSCAITSHDHELLHWAESLPAHVVSGPDLMARNMVERHPTLRPGDAFLHNDPYHGGAHAAD